MKKREERDWTPLRSRGFTPLPTGRVVSLLSGLTVELLFYSSRINRKSKTRFCLSPNWTSKVSTTPEPICPSLNLGIESEFWSWSLSLIVSFSFSSPGRFFLTLLILEPIFFFLLNLLIQRLSFLRSFTLLLGVKQLMNGLSRCLTAGGLITSWTYVTYSPTIPSFSPEPLQLVLTGEKSCWNLICFTEEKSGEIRNRRVTLATSFTHLPPQLNSSLGDWIASAGLLWLVPEKTLP